MRRSKNPPPKPVVDSSDYGTSMHGASTDLLTFSKLIRESMQTLASSKRAPDAVAPIIACQTGSAPGGSRARSGEHSERTLDAPKRSRTIENGATALIWFRCGANHADVHLSVLRAL